MDHAELKKQSTSMDETYDEMSKKIVEMSSPMFLADYI